MSIGYTALVRLSLFSVILFGLASRAAAQDTSPQTSSADAAPSTDPRFVEARERNSAGEALFEAGNFGAALTEFERVYQLLDGSPSRYFVLYNIGQCHERLFRYDRAIEFYRRYLVEGGPEAEDRAEVDATVRGLEALLGTVEITANVPTAQLWIDDIEVGAFDAEHQAVRVPSGRHTVELRADGFVPAQREVQVLSRGRVSAALVLEELSDYEGVEPWLFWTSAGAGAAALVVGGVFGILAMTQSSDADARCPNAACDPATAEAWSENTVALRDSIQRNALIADILYGTGALFGVTALVLAFLTDWNGDEAPQSATRTRLLLLPSAAPGYVGVSLTGAF
jgi:hypothetical protein